MAQKKTMRHASGKKALRQSRARRTQNVAVRQRVRTLTASVVREIEAKNFEGASAAFKTAQSALQKAAKRGVVATNAASRRISRLAARIAGVKKS